MPVKLHPSFTSEASISIVFFFSALAFSICCFAAAANLCFRNSWKTLSEASSSLTARSPRMLPFPNNFTAVALMVSASSMASPTSSSPSFELYFSILESSSSGSSGSSASGIVLSTVSFKPTRYPIFISSLISSRKRLLSSSLSSRFIQSSKDSSISFCSMTSPSEYKNTFLIFSIVSSSWFASSSSAKSRESCLVRNVPRSFTSCFFSRVV
mmetsp:Transcript_30606/g.57325  ORF Transcript_30606/g.57325 Transcript_30606/m.57325 type:complete len:212 (+) Transcript_30606:181-816(+)